MFQDYCNQFYINNYRVRVPNYPVSIALHRDSLRCDILNYQIANIKTGFMVFSIPPDMRAKFDGQIFGAAGMKSTLGKLDCLGNRKLSLGG